MALDSTYPDSVSLVRPPNTTMPKTLAALPRSQYATTLSLVSGKNDDLTDDLVLSGFRWIDLLREKSVEGPPEGDATASMLEVTVRRVGDLNAFRYGVVGRPLGKMREHEHEKNCFDKLGAALRKAGKALNIDAMILAHSEAHESVSYTKHHYPDCFGTGRFERQIQVNSRFMRGSSC